MMRPLPLCLLLTATFASACLVPARIEGTEPTDCEDGVDNDADGTTDCDDSSCANAAVCAGDTDNPGDDTPGGSDTDTSPPSDTPTTDNRAPTAAVVEITPSAPTDTDALTCSVTTPSTDPDGDPVTYAFAWAIDGVNQPAYASDTVPASATRPGQTWRCSVTPSDGDLDGPRAADSVTIASQDLPPTQPGVQLRPDPAYDADDLTCIIATPSVDPEGGVVGYTYTWTRDGAATVYTTMLVASSETSVGEQWACTATPSDGAQTGVAGTSNVVTILADGSGGTGGGGTGGGGTGGGGTGGGGTPIDTADTAADTAAAVAPVEAFAISAEFGYNATTQRTATLTIGGAPLDPVLVVNLGAVEYFSLNDDTVGCTVLAFPSGNPALASFATQAGILFGWEAAQPYTYDYTDCNGVVDVAAAEALVLDLTDPTFLWGFGIQQNLGATASGALTQAGAPLNNYLGGGFAGSWNSAVPITAITAAEYDPDPGFVYGFQQAQGSLVISPTGTLVQLTASQMTLGGVLQSAYYVVRDVYYYTLTP